jgi:Tol biopolymer transport system component
MPTLEELMRRELEEQIPPVNDELFHQLEQKRRGRHVRRSIGTFVLTVAVLLGTVGGFVGLSHLFREDSASGPATTGRALIVERVTSEVDDRPSLWVANPDGSDPRTLVRLSGAPSVSPDGRTLAFIWFEGMGNHPSLATMALSDGVPHQLTAPSVAAGSPEWSPDGQRIAYVRVLPGADSLWITDADGSGDLRVPIDMAEIRSPTWSPDGSAIAFAASPRDGSGVPESNIYVYNLGSEQLDQVSSTPDIGEDETTWSPDGSRIAFTANERVGGPDQWRTSVWTMTPQGQNLRLVAGDERSFFSPAWGRDSSSMLISDGDWVYHVELSNGQISQLVEGTSAVWSPQLLGPPVEPAPSPSDAIELKGMPFQVCRPMSIPGDFGTALDTVWVFEKAPDQGCVGYEGYLYVGFGGQEEVVTFTGLRGTECDTGCWPLASPDIDANGVDEIAIGIGGSRASGYGSFILYGVQLEHGGGRIVPVTFDCGPGCDPIPWIDVGVVQGRAMGAFCGRFSENLSAGQGLMRWSSNGQRITGDLWVLDLEALRLDPDYGVSQPASDPLPDGTEELCGSSVFWPEDLPNYPIEKLIRQ